MLDAYGLPIPHRAFEERRMATAREGYEADCRRRGISPDWTGIDSDTRYLWLMTADALLAYGDERDTEAATDEVRRAGGAKFH